MAILGFDPGRDKCGIAIVEQTNELLWHQVVAASVVIEQIQQLSHQFSLDLIVMGDQTTANQWKAAIEKVMISSLLVVMVDERNSSLEARERYWQMYPPQGLQRFIPQGMRLPPRPIDDIVAILLIERYLATIN